MQAVAGGLTAALAGDLKAAADEDEDDGVAGLDDLEAVFAAGHDEALQRQAAVAEGADVKLHRWPPRGRGGAGG